jgi:hypothetical protein
LENKGNFELLNRREIFFKNLYIDNFVGVVSKETDSLAEENHGRRVRPGRKSESDAESLDRPMGFSRILLNNDGYVFRHEDDLGKRQKRITGINDSGQHYEAAEGHVRVDSRGGNVMLLASIGAGKHASPRLCEISIGIGVHVLHTFIEEIQIDFMAGVEGRTRETVNGLGTDV